MDPTYRDRAAYIDGTLLVADTHFGKGEASTVEFPIGAGEDCVDRLEGLLDRFEPEEVVLAGDVFHSFDYVPETADEALSGVVRTVREAGARLVVVEGNHDTMLGAAYSGELHDEYELDTDGAETVVVTHGHEEPNTPADAYVVGHDHPAIEIEGQKRPCFLVGDGAYRRSDVLVLPSFNRLVEGLSVGGRLGASRPELSPLVTGISQYRPVVFDPESEETLTFPPLGQFSRML
ncbi:metallophosphoesterase [Halosimplex pelagicum]|uniref:Metallophosphoesterase n=1 Tax=Halosimplex pelagicum TaxID=869886 RepID=A0A7D5TVZ5_9EURY|nr:metallophosphoesterase [Halosimplex pelagicum]QLH84392.1 metallophosphoesterase [Halosimplex pelagicum]